MQSLDIVGKSWFSSKASIRRHRRVYLSHRSRMLMSSNFWKTHGIRLIDYSILMFTEASQSPWSQ